MGLGFELSESMTGSFHRFDDPMKDGVLRVTLRLGVDGLRRFARERRIEADGVIVAEGLAENGGSGRTVHGTITWKLLDENRVPYALTFQGDDEKTYHLRGQRDFFLYNAIGSLTTMSASLYDDRDREIGRADLAFEPRMEIPALVRSFRPRLRVWSFGRKKKK
ncbi:MAG: hypothetical protein KF764_10700 [Labilithrix sp.]|nr:hypothetical protein [Labilithrix sp.]